MSDLFPERLEPMAPVLEPGGQQPRRQPASGLKRRPAAPVTNDPETGEDSDGPPHQVDDLA